ncbi:MAG: radical SAM protein [Elusimicrobia bacterium]|nr:radical SAM protein [Elusimicrobiota bacterium]
MCGEKWVWTQGKEARRHLRTLSPPEQETLKHRFLELISLCRGHLPALLKRKDLRNSMRGRDIPATLSASEDLLDFLTAGVLKAWATDPASFARVWRPIGILPPDQYLALVLQVAEGCAWNQCAFCDFYKGRPSRVRSLDEIRRHADDAERFFGPALAGRCSIFLGDANAFQAPPNLLIPIAEELSVRFPQLAEPQGDGVGGLYSFAEATRLSAWTQADLQALARTGYRRAYLGVETGSKDLRRQLKKPGTADTVAESVLKLKTAGIAVGLIVLLGAGGKENADDHVRGTTDLLRNSNLGPGDLLYFSPLVAGPESPYAHTSARGGWTSLSEEQVLAQKAEIESHLPPRGERRALYDIREFVY